jgi:hypothetical protein
MSIITKCDNCDCELKNGSPIHLSFGFGTYLDGEEYDFCSIEHLTEFCKKISSEKKPEYEEMEASEIEGEEYDKQL